MEEHTKSQPITKAQVWAAYREVGKHGKSGGVDAVTLRDYEQRKSKELYKVWNRMTSGSYYPPAVRRTEIPKSDGKTRKLGIPTVSDRVAQPVVKHYLEPQLEPYFHRNSFGYRPGRNAYQAIQQATAQCYSKAWVQDLDIEGFFDHPDHALLLKALQRHTTERWVLMYVERWLKAPIEEKGRLYYPQRGSPQGGVISPLLSNLYLHYAFDRWMDLHHEGVPFERYADDIVVHCSSKADAEDLMQTISIRLQQCGLRLHPEKTKIVYCKTTGRKGDHEQVSFDFPGLTFRPKKARRSDRGEYFTSYGPVRISRKATRRIITLLRSKKLHSRSGRSLEDLSKELSVHLRGWINYYGRLKMSYLRPVMRYVNTCLIKWACRRHKRFKRSMKQAHQWLRQLSQDYPNLFVHWQYGFTP